MAHVDDKLVRTVGCIGTVLSMPDGALVIVYGIGGNLATALLTVVGDDAPVALINKQSELLGGLHAVGQSLAGGVCRQRAALPHVYGLVLFGGEDTFLGRTILICFLIMYSGTLRCSAQMGIAVMVSLHQDGLANGSAYARQSRKSCIGNERINGTNDKAEGRLSVLALVSLQYV